MKRTLSFALALVLILSISIVSYAATPVKVSNGQIIVKTDYEQLCPFSVSVSGGSTYYIYLQYLYAPTSSTVSRQLRSGASSKRQSDISFIVSPDSTAEIDVPIGVYKLYYCAGETWYGTQEKFGRSSGYYSSDELLNFYADSQYYQGHSLELWAQVGGNFEDYSVSESSFPDTEETEEDKTDGKVPVGKTSGSSSGTAGKYKTIDDLPDNPSDMNQLVKDWLAYPAYIEDFHAVDSEVTIKVGERTKMLLFRSQSYNGADYEWTWYGGGSVSLDWAGNGVGWAGHNHVGYFTATKACTIFVCATDPNGQVAHMVIHAK